MFFYATWRNWVLVGDRALGASPEGEDPLHFVYLGDRQAEKLGDLLLHSS
ncbi:MAG: hypothetical protein ACMG55_14250 [Microcoleus sp.]